MSMMSHRRVVAWGIVALGLAAGPAVAAPLDPGSPLFTSRSQGDVVLAGGSYVFNLGTSTPTLAFYDGPVFTTVATGFVSNGINVFSFDSLRVAAGTVLTVNQSSASGPLALLSRTTIAMAGTIDVSGAGSLGLMGGPGATNFGLGGQGRTGSTGSPGPGGVVASGGGGGGFGGAGQAGGNATIYQPGTSNPIVLAPGGAGGAAYGNLADRLQGGSMGGFGGSTGFNSSGFPNAPGFGGGAIELGAIGAITVSGTINANGGDGSFLTGQLYGGGGGGSGGGVLIHGESVALSGTIHAAGGAGGGRSFSNGAGGAGGGGQVLVQYASTGSYSRTGTVNVGSGATAGRFDVVPLSVPEPSSLVLLGVAALGGAGWAARRRPG